jgi:hypothetical protein
MTDIKIDTSGLDKLLAKLDSTVDHWLAGVAESIVTDVKLSFGTSPDGRSYTRGSISHVASQPGYPPNVDTGTLRASIRHEKRGPYEYWVMDGVEYGIWLEDGTPNIAPRPFMRPAFDAARRRIEGDLGAALGQELEK